MRFDLFTGAVSRFSIITDLIIFQTLGESQSTRNLVSRWCREGKIVRLKRGMYVLSEQYRRPSRFLPYVVANNLLTPSYVSLESALAHYGLIPEYVAEITSVCLKRPKRFENTLGRFTYRKLDPLSYPPGIVRFTDNGESFLIASKEKALLDKIYFSHTQRTFRCSYLTDSLRIEEDDLRAMDFDAIKRYAAAYPTKKMMSATHKIEDAYGY